MDGHEEAVRAGADDLEHGAEQRAAGEVVGGGRVVAQGVGALRLDDQLRLDRGRDEVGHSGPVHDGAAQLPVGALYGGARAAQRLDVEVAVEAHGERDAVHGPAVRQ